MQNYIKIDSKEPKIIRSTVDERIKNYRAEIAIKHDPKLQIEAGDIQPKPEPEIGPEVPDDTFFITQEMSDEKISFKNELEKLTIQIQNNIQVGCPHSAKNKHFGNYILF